MFWQGKADMLPHDLEQRNGGQTETADVEMPLHVTIKTTSAQLVVAIRKVRLGQLDLDSWTWSSRMKDYFFLSLVRSILDVRPILVNLTRKYPPSDPDDDALFPWRP